VAGLLAYIRLFILGARATAQAASADPPVVPAEEATARAGILH
jgi:hypothetical protein